METVKFCPKCGHQVQEGETYCPNCGANLVENTISADNVNNHAGRDVSSSSNSSSTVGLVMGILSICLMSLLFGIIGIALCAPRRNDDDKAKSGFICSIIGIAISVFFIVGCVIFFVLNATEPL